MPIKLDGEKILVTEGDQSYELERVKSYGYRDLSQETTQPPTITPTTSVEDIKIISPFFRIDLPSKFETDHKKISLPWHQEAGYYLKNGNCTPNSIVLSTYLHKCKKSEGAIEISIDPSVELYKHSSKFLDNYKKKFLRVTCPTPKNYISVETNFGEVVIFDFLRPHRSGLNKSSLVRLTYLKRATSILDLDKWNYSAKK